MNAAIDFLAEHGAMLLSGTTLLLTAGTIVIACRRAPIERQRLAELSLMAVILWAILALWPLPRWPWASEAIVLPTRQHDSASNDRSVVRNRPIASRRPESIRAEPALLTVRTAAGRREGMPAAPLASRFDGRRVAVIAYLWGAVAAAAWLIGSRFLLWRLMRRCEPPEMWLSELFAALNERCARRAVLLVSSRCGWPFSYGLARSTIVLPRRLCVFERTDTLRHVLLHELSHVRQRDAWGHALFSLMLPLLYFHPIYWWLRTTARQAREAIADDWASRQSSPESYAAQLIRLAREMSPPPKAPWAAMAIIGSSSQFYRRMTMLLTREKPLATRCSRGWKIGTLLGAALGVGGAALWIGIEPVAAQVGRPKAKIEIHVDKVRQQPLEASAANKEVVGTSQVKFLGPAGLRGEWVADARGDRMPYNFTLPSQASRKFRQGSVYRLKLTDLPRRPGVEIYPTLEIARPVPESEAFLNHAAVPIQFTEEDFDQALSGNLVAKVIYLPSADQQETAIAGVETLVSTRVEPGVDPVAEAKRKGAILAILRMGDAPAPLGETAIESPQAATGLLQPSAAVGIENSEDAEQDGSRSPRSARLRFSASQLDLVEWIGVYSDAVRDAEVMAHDLELHEKAEKSTPGVTPGSELHRMRVQKKAAERKVSLLLKLAKGALAAAKAEADAAKRDLDMLKSAEEDAAVANRAVRESRRRYETAQAEVDLLESLLSEASSD